MGDKTALIIFSEIVQSLEEVRALAADIFMQIEAKSQKLSDEEIAVEELALRAMRGTRIPELKSTDFFADEEQAEFTLLKGCAEIEEKTVEMIELCLEFTPPL